MLGANSVWGFEYEQRAQKVRMTAYTHSEDDHVKWGKKTASGSDLRYEKTYTSAATDWSWLPLGTEFRIKGTNRHYVVDDYGSALVNKKTIDLYFPSRTMMNQFGMGHFDIVITKHGSYEKSKKRLESAVKWGAGKHVKIMLWKIKENERINKGKPEIYEAVPSLDAEPNEKLMARLSIPKWEWDDAAPAIGEPCPKQPTLVKAKAVASDDPRLTVSATTNKTTDLAMVEKKDRLEE